MYSYVSERDPHRAFRELCARAVDPRSEIPHDTAVDTLGVADSVGYASPHWDLRPSLPETLFPGSVASAYDKGRNVHAREAHRVMHANMGHSTGQWAPPRRAQTDRPAYVDWIPDHSGP